MQTRSPGKNNFFLEYVFLITTYKHTHIDNDTDGRFTGLFLVFCGTLAQHKAMASLHPARVS